MNKQVKVPFLQGMVTQTSAMNRDSGAFHGGNDYSAPIGTPIQAGASGTVIWSGNNPGGHGYAVVIRDANGNSMLYSHMGTAGNPPANMPAVGTEVKAGDTIGSVGNTGSVQISNGGGVLHVTALDSVYTKEVEKRGASLSNPQTDSAALGVSTKPEERKRSHILNPDEYMQDNADLFKPGLEISPHTTDPTSSTSHSQSTTPTDPMGTDDSKSIMDAASAGATTRVDENYSHEGRNASSASSTPPTPKPPPGPAGDSIDAHLPDGTRVVSTSTTVNGQTTLTAELRDKDGQVLLSAGAGQTMERDPDTGIVRVRTEGSEQVQQYDPATGEVGSGVWPGSSDAGKSITPDTVVADASNDLPDIGTLPTFGPGVQVADAGDLTGAGTMTDAGWIPAGGAGLPSTSASAPTPTNSFTNYLSSQSNPLTPAQQTALATQLDKLNLGGEDALSFYPLPGGGALIANADGDIVGEINRSCTTADLNLKATAIDADGNTVEVNNHISEQGTVLTDNALVQQQAANMFNSLMAVNNWDHLSDLGKLSALVNLYNATDKLGEAFGATGDNLPGDLGAAAGWLSLAQGLQSGDNLIILNGLNTVSGGMVDQAIGDMVGQELPYVSTLLELRNFADDPEKATCTMVGTYIGEIVGAYFGPIGAAIGGALGGMLGGMVASALDDDPPAPAGAAHFSWDANGHIQHTVDFSESGGGEAASSVAAGVQAMLEQVVQAINATHPDTADDVALNPYCLPRVSFKADAGGATMEVTLGNGQVASQSVNSPQFGEWLLQVVQDTGGIAPAWQVQTLRMHAQQMRSDGADEAQVAAVAGITSTYVAELGEVGSASLSVQGNAAQSADFKSQSFGVLVVHLHDDPNVQAAQAQLSEVLRDIDSDGYFEKTQWLSATDSRGKLQGLLTLDANGDGVIQTRDILNLGGNVGADGDMTTQAALATQNAALQRNNVEWLDANGDGQLTAQDPAFAAIKLWVDVNQDGKMEAGEGQSLGSQNITSINFKTGEITYADGSIDALTAATLSGDTEGIRLTQIQQADANGVLHAWDAGPLVEHEGYQGEQWVTDITGTHWQQVREQTYEQQAKRTGDWEGTAAQDAHRHGGGNAGQAPTETTATGATDLGPIKTQANQTTQSTVTAGDSRITSNATTTNGAVSNPASTTSSATNSASTRIVFVPTGATSTQNELRRATDSMIESAQSSLFGVGANAGLGVLTAVGLGAVQNVQAAEQRPALVSDVLTASITPTTTPNTVSSSNPLSNPSVTWRQVDLDSFAVFSLGKTAPAANTTPSTTALTPATASSSSPEHALSAWVLATVIAPANSSANTGASHTATWANLTTPAQTPSLTPATPAASVLALTYPVVQGEVLDGTEDVVLRLSQSVLLANDSTVNASASPNQPALTITAVSGAAHGQVSLVNGEVLFTPEANFHGTASFTYTVTDQYGLSTNSTATLQLAAVNDAPVAVGETISENEDTTLVISQAALLQNDSDMDNAHADLVIARVQAGTGGTVSLNASGDVVFTPTPNYNGNATFTYWVQDPEGLESNAVTTTVVLAAVNDAPTVQGEIVTGASEDAVFHINASTLLANDHDVDDPDSALRLSWVGNATGGAVSLDVSGNVVFTPTANFNGNATFQYKVQDAAGLESAVVQAVIPVAAVNDVPVAVDDQFTTYTNSTMTIAFAQLTSNDTDADRDALTVSAVRDNAHGHASIVDGQVQFVATAGFTGMASFDYLSDDGQGGQAWATATVDVKTPPNAYPTVVLTGTNFFGTGGPGIDVAYASWHLSDDSGVASFSLQSYSVYRFYSYVGWAWGDLSDVLTQFQNSSTGMYWDWRRYAGIAQLESTWVVTDDKGLSNTWHFNYDISRGVTANYMEHSGYYTPPVILDLNGNGVHFTSLQNSNVTMDVNFDGIQDKMAWAGNDDGVLVWDKDQNHHITDVSEFAFQTLKAGAQTDLEGLQALDTNGNGLLDAGDTQFAEFAVWQDANGNGVTDAGEFKTLTELDIAHITLHSDGQMRNAGTLLANSGSGETDATVMGNAAFTRTDGTTGVVADTMLAYEAGHATRTAAATTTPIADTSAADAHTAEIIRQALLFNQVCNTAMTGDSTLLGFVPIQPDVQLHDMLVIPHDGSHQLMQSA